jgi:hypothetical protein
MNIVTGESETGYHGLSQVHTVWNTVKKLVIQTITV